MSTLGKYILILTCGAVAYKILSDNGIISLHAQNAHFSIFSENADVALNSGRSKYSVNSNSVEKKEVIVQKTVKKNVFNFSLLTMKSNGALAAFKATFAGIAGQSNVAIQGE